MPPAWGSGQRLTSPPPCQLSARPVHCIGRPGGAIGQGVVRARPEAWYYGMCAPRTCCRLTPRLRTLLPGSICVGRGAVPGAAGKQGMISVICHLAACCFCLLSRAPHLGEGPARQGEPEGAPLPHYGTHTGLFSPTLGVIGILIFWGGQLAGCSTRKTPNPRGTRPRAPTQVATCMQACTAWVTSGAPSSPLHRV